MFANEPENDAHPNHQLAPASLEVNWDPFNLTMRADAKVGLEIQTTNRQQIY